MKHITALTIILVLSLSSWAKKQEVKSSIESVTVYTNVAFIGEQYLNPSHLQDTLQLNLGADRFMFAERNTVKMEKKKKIIGKMIEVTYAYEFTVKNQKSKTVNIEVQDQIPLSRKDKIDIKVIENSGGSLNKENGVIQWDLKLRPQEKETFDFIYKVKYPKDESVNLPPA